jgi:hypothetical protein
LLRSPFYLALLNKVIFIFFLLTGVILQHSTFNPSKFPLDCQGEDLKQTYSHGPNNLSTSRSTGGDQTCNNANKHNGPMPACSQALEGPRHLCRERLTVLPVDLHLKIALLRVRRSPSINGDAFARRNHSKSNNKYLKCNRLCIMTQ